VVLTSRAWWLIIVSVLMLVMGILAGQPVVSLLGLAIVCWLTFEGILFSFRVKCVFRQLKLRRVVRDDRGVVTSLWAGRTFEVRLTLRVDGPLALPYVAFEEPTPFGLEVIDGEPRGEGTVHPDVPLYARYRIKSPHAGSARFEGVRVQVADLQGLFYFAGFVHLETIYRILPPFVDAEGKTATGKRYNLLPPPGIHRLPRPGSGSELLDLRDYIPGDPPKTIAWKVSARRDRLITKEYESEVPVRCTLFIDTSQSVRIGPPGRNALTRLVEIAAGVAQANLASRDLTGLCLFDEHGTKIVKPARSRRHLVQLLNELADAAGQPAAAGHAPIEALLPLAYSFATEVYPEQLDSAVNHVPGWLPYLVPIPSPWVRPVSVLGRLYRWTVLPIVSVIYFLIFSSLFLELADNYGQYDEQLQTLVASVWLAMTRDPDVSIVGPPERLVSLDLVFVGFLALALVLFPLWIILWRDALPLLFSPHRRRMTRMRKKLAALFATRYDLGPGGVELLLQDDSHMSAALGRFLSEHHIPYTPQLFDRHGHYLFRSPAKLERLGAALLRAVGKGHDNELFVLFVDVVELEKDLEPLLRAVKVALARHHHVMLIVPWPPDLESPRRDSTTPATTPEPKPSGEKPKRGRRPAYSRMTLGELREHIKTLMARRYHRAYHRVSKKFARLHVPVLCATETDPVPLILDRLDRLRGVRRRR
jgi:uncharacterized protein (DUF58 family)